MTEALEVKLQEAAEGLADQAVELEVNDLAGIERASSFFISCSKAIKQIKEYWKEPKQSSRATWKAICDKENEMLRIPESAKEVVENKIRVFRAEEKKRIEEEQRKADEARRKEEERIKNQELKKAEKALAKGDEEKAEEHLENVDKVFVPPTTVATIASKTQQTDQGSLSHVKDLKIELHDIKAVAQGIADGKLPPHIIDIKPGLVKAWAKGNGLGEGMHYGILITETEVFRARGK